jgi:hypothetical protein
MNNAIIEIQYYMSADNWGDGKSVCLWRLEGSVCTKIARFQSDEAARKFAEHFHFPLSDALKKRLEATK